MHTIPPSSPPTQLTGQWEGNGVSRDSSKLLAEAGGDRHSLTLWQLPGNVLRSDSAKPAQPVRVGHIPAMLRFLCLLLKAEVTLTGSFGT